MAVAGTRCSDLAITRRFYERHYPENYRLTQPLKFREAGVPDAQVMPSLRHKDQVPQQALKRRINEQGQRVRGR